MIRNYSDMPIYKQSLGLAIRIHEMTLKLSKLETYEEGSQIRRSAKSIPANLAEGYGRRTYKNEYIRYLIFALSSCDETIVHLEILYKTRSIGEDLYSSLIKEYNHLGRDINNYLKHVVRHHNNFN